jgi:hypothetical protein
VLSVPQLRVLCESTGPAMIRAAASKTVNHDRIMFRSPAGLIRSARCEPIQTRDRSMSCCVRRIAACAAASRASRMRLRRANGSGCKTGANRRSSQRNEWQGSRFLHASRQVNGIQDLRFWRRMPRV